MYLFVKLVSEKDMDSSVVCFTLQQDENGKRGNGNLGNKVSFWLFPAKLGGQCCIFSVNVGMEESTEQRKRKSCFAALDVNGKRLILSSLTIPNDGIKLC